MEIKMDANGGYTIRGTEAELEELISFITGAITQRHVHGVHATTMHNALEGGKRTLTVIIEEP